ncbi:unnamed protein product [Vitrella brassicaformis CCMP3155]|uniref:ER membrane protein complex subunit 2 n=1 Tax=Vitrella brassicaformis (strain CCMP3155) TaxID=1169540 RepID=A0A0G4FF18_VITBC|nr:unnamed protein product [Vitrella brassicaformis CCMP3155]|eukprot:CEM11632.1 unnamed protein product [Vitrella brassicaformis CCMP3155]
MDEAGTQMTLLRKLKERMSTRRPDEILRYGSQLLRRYSNRLHDELYTILEHVLLAACDMGHRQWIDYCMSALRSKFAGSIRLRRLEGMVKEAQGDYQGAKQIYQKILEEKPEDMLTRKRFIALYKGQRRMAECVDYLNKYLEEFVTDTEAWHELGEIYISDNCLSKATFCFEELVMYDHRNPYYVITYAELLYATGEYELSRKYYCFALEMDDRNTRALWGILLANEQLHGSKVFPIASSAASPATDKPPTSSKRKDGHGSSSAANSPATQSVTPSTTQSSSTREEHTARVLTKMALAKLKEVYVRVKGGHAQSTLAVLQDMGA